MDLNIVTLEITGLIIAFDHYDNLVSALAAGSGNADEEHLKIRSKNQEHVNAFFGAATFCEEDNRLKSLSGIKETISTQLTALKTGEIHELVEKLEKDVKKIKKLYKTRKS